MALSRSQGEESLDGSFNIFALCKIYQEQLLELNLLVLFFKRMYIYGVRYRKYPNFLKKVKITEEFFFYIYRMRRLYNLIRYYTPIYFLPYGVDPLEGAFCI